MNDPQKLGATLPENARSRIGLELQRVYADLEAAPLPARILELLHQLGGREIKALDDPHPATPPSQS